MMRELSVECGGKTTWTLSTKFIRANWARGRRTRAGPFSVWATQRQLDERMFAFLDDIRWFPISTSFEGTLDTRAHPVHFGKTQICNQARQTSWLRCVDDGCSKGGHVLPPDQQGLIVFGTPQGSAEFVQRELASFFSEAPVSFGPHSPGARPSERFVVALVFPADTSSACFTQFQSTNLSGTWTSPPRRGQNRRTGGGGGWPPSVTRRAAAIDTMMVSPLSRWSASRTVPTSTEQRQAAISGVVRGGRTSLTCGLFM